MSNTYVKKYDVGQIKLDLPYANYIHELPLLSFGDIQHTVNLSLVFNHARYTEEAEDNKNPFFISPGFKLNMQKRIIINTSSVITAFQESNGNCVDLTNNDGIYTFSDDSQRILRKIGSTYEVEYPDFSKEVYNTDGLITGVYDKYSKSILSYTYDDETLISISYRDSKEILLGYNSSDQLATITYAGCPINIYYNNDRSLNFIKHYSDEYYTFDFTNGYKVLSGDSVVSVDSAVKTITVTTDTTDKTITVRDHHENITLYKFDCSVNPNETNNRVDITDNNGVKTRVQCQNNKILYSYEIGDDVEFNGNKFLGNVEIYRTSDDLKNAQAVGKQTLNDGITMTPDSSNTTTLSCGGINNPYIKGYYLVTGWAKINRNITNSPENCICISRTGYDGVDEINIWIDGNHTREWQFFACKFHMDAAIVYVRPKISDALEFKDVRLTYQATHIWDKDFKSHISMSEDVLFKGSDTISFNGLKFYYSVNNSNIEIASDDDEQRIVTFSDVMRYKLRKKKYGVCNEIYYNNGKNVITGTTDLKVFYNNDYVSISDFDLGIKVYSNNKTSLTRINVDEANPSSNIVKTQTVGDDTVSTETLNSKLDNKETTSDGIKVSYQYDYDTEGYQSTGRGLIFKQTTMPITDADDSNTIVKQYNYNPELTKLESYIDEFNKTTYYTTDDVWGVVTAVTLPDGSVITDTYDGDRSVLMKKAFDNNETRKNVFGYTDGRLTSITGGALSYGFGYNTDNGELASVSKNGAGVEHHAYTENIDESTQEKTGETTVVSKYPTESGALHTETKLFDKYGRLKSVGGVLSNVYDLNPYFFYLEDNLIHKTMEDYDRTEDGELTHSSPSADGKDALLSEVTDSLANEITQYGYDNGKLTAAVTYNNQRNNDGSIDEESVLRQETFVYDDIGRVTKDRYIYEIMNPQTAEQEIVYATAVPDNRISSYTYKLNGNVKAQTSNVYDKYKRISQKTYTVGGKSFSKKINYSKTRPISVEDKCVNTIIANTAYEYDSMGRILKEKDGAGNVLKSYTYDTYGQLTKEVNNVLDKTFDYVYNGIGNIESVTKNGVTTQLGYDSDNPDVLTSYGNKAITYNANGGVSSYDGWDYTWTRGKLSTIRKSSGGSSRAVIAPVLSPSRTYSFTYNAFGQRTCKSYSYFLPNGAIVSVQTGETTYYNKQFKYDASGRLIAEIIEETQYGVGDISKSLKYLYDESGMIGVQYTNGANTSTYYYLRNLQGDVIGIYNTSGTKVVGYTYDAWGNCTIDSSTTNYDIAHDNPIRYRGYYYDEDTGLYYLNARYYNPEWRRFISPDDTSYLDPENVNGLNLYCYCGNDPVNYCDPSGNDPEWWQWALFGVGVALVVTAAIMAAVGTGGVAAFGMGALIGSATVGGAGALIGGAVGYATGGLDGIAGGAMACFGIGAIVGFAVGGIIGYANFGSFASQAKLETHFIKHGSEFGQMYQTSAEYAKGAKYVIRHGQKVKYLYKGKKTVGYIRFLGNAGKANYAFVGLNGTKVATYGVRSVQELAKLGISLFV